MQRPTADQPHYGAHLGDVDYWRPYVESALQTAGLPNAELESPFVGSFPTFLVGDLVVKLFGPNFDGEECARAERAMHALLAGNPHIPAPAVAGSGALFDDAPAWPFLITQRLRGRAVREDPATDAIARRLGEVVAALHRLPPPAKVVERDEVPEFRADAVPRLRKNGLPERLVAQVPAYLADAPPPSTLVHADITADHVFVRDGGLEAIIDWGDAIEADPFYEFVAVYFDALDGERGLFGAFLDGYGWRREDDFTRRALQGVLSFQFNAIASVAELVDLDTIKTLDELAEQLFG